MTQLIINPNTPDAFTVQLSQGVNSIGRAAGNQVQLEHESIREQHAEIHLFGTQAALLDLAGATNAQPRDLQPGTRFLVGDVELEFQCDTRSAVTAPAAATAQPKGPTSAIPCSRHAVARAEWVCTQCGKHFCVGCVKHALRGTAPCPDCGGSCETLRSHLAAPNATDFAGLIPNVLRYPLAGDGIYLVVGGALFFSVCEFFVKSAVFIGILLEVVIGGYLASYVKDVVRTSAMGDDKPPEWPDFENWIDDLLQPAIQLVAVYLLAFGPWILLRNMNWSLGAVWVWIAGFWGCFSFPILWLALSMTDSIASILNPFPLLKAITRTLPQYLITVCFFCAVVGCSLGIDWLLSMAGVVPILPTLISWFCTVYLLSVGMRIIGLYYRFTHHRFDW